jgi:hypothetical protein
MISAEAAIDASGGGKPMQQAPAATCLFLDIGGVLLTNGWDHHARQRAATHFKLDWAEMEGRHSLTFETHEEGKLTFDEYLSRVVFYQERAFTRARFRNFMFGQSKSYPEMIDMVARLKVRYGLKIAVVSNEARELNAHRIQKFRLGAFVDFLFPPASSTSASPTLRSFGWHWTSLRCRPGKWSISKTPRCLSRSPKVWGFAAFFTRTTGQRARNWRRSGCRTTKEPAMRPADPHVLTLIRTDEELMIARSAARILKLGLRAGAGSG